jgi:hypothetical protein
MHFVPLPGVPGARLVHSMQRVSIKRSVVTLCTGRGLGIARTVEAV